MKKRITSLILAAVMALSCLLMSACSYNWSKDAAGQVTLDLNAALSGTLEADKVDVVTKAYLEDAYHALLASFGADKSLRKDGDDILAADKVKIDISVKQQLLVYESNELYTETGYVYDMGKEETTTDALKKLIRKDLEERLAEGGSGMKVGETYTVTGNLYADKTGTSSSAKVSFTAGSDKNIAVPTTVTYTVTQANADAPTVTLGANDIFNVYFTKTVDGKTNTEKSWTYNFSSSALSGGVKYDPYKKDGLSDPFYLALLDKGVQLNDSGASAKADQKIGMHDWVKVTMTVNYKNDKDASVSVADINNKSYTFDMAVDTSDVVTKWVRDDILAHINETGDDAQNRLANGSYTLTKMLYIDKDNKAFEKTNDLYDADDKDVTEQEVTVTYKVSSVYAGDWDTLTVKETVDGEEKEVTYDYYVSAITLLPEKVTFEDLLDSSKANGSKDDDSATRYFYVLKEEIADTEDEDGDEDKEEIIEVRYTNNYYGEFLFKTKPADGENVKYYGEKVTESTVEGEEDKVEDLTELYLYDGLKTEVDGEDAEKVLVETEDQMVLYALEVYLRAHEKEMKRQRGIDVMWSKILDASTVTVPQALLDAYYKEYYENARYDFNVEHSGIYSEKVDGKTQTYTEFEAYLIAQLDVKDKSEIRAAVDKLAKDELKPRLVVYKLAEALQIEVPADEWETIMANVEYQWQYNNYMYYYYYSMYGDYVTYFGYEYYDTMEAYIAANYGSEDGIRAGVLFDKIMEKLYDDYKGSMTFEKTADDK